MYNRYMAALCILSVLLPLFILCGSGGTDDFDILIKNGTIVDGTGENRFKADVGITGNSLTAIGDLNGKTAAKILNAEGSVVSPGFIDMHTHCDRGLDRPSANANLNYLIQGVTTVVTGNCGGAVSLNVAQTKKRWEKQGIGTNVVYLVGFGDIKREVMGVEPRAANLEEIEKMRSLLEQAMKEGAWGMSTGLEFIPDRYASTEEVISVAKVLREFGGIYTSHMRFENEHILDGIKETIRIGEETGVPVNIAHLKITGKNNWGLMKDVVTLVNKTRARGVVITADQYPYVQGSPIGLLWTFPEIPDTVRPLSEIRKKMRERGLAKTRRIELEQLYIEELKKALSNKSMKEQIRQLTVEGRPHDPSPVAMWGWHDFCILVAEKNSHSVGKNFIDLVKEQNRDPFDIVADLIINEPGILYGSGSQSWDDHDDALKQDWVMVSSDGGAFPIIKDEDKPELGHPRIFGSQTRVLRKYVREEKIITLENAIYKMSSLPASFLGMKDRGLIKKGTKADLVIFDPETVRDNATYADFQKYSSGVEYVIINGKISIENGQYKGALNGKVLLLKNRS